jgi:hypothetical protein
MESTSLAVKAAQLAISKITPWNKIINWALRKTVPFDESLIVPLLEFTPVISLNYNQHIMDLRLSMTVRNFSAYDIEILGHRCEILLESTPFMAIERTDIFTLKTGEMRKIHFEHHLSPGEIRRAEEKANAAKIHIGAYKFAFSARTRFGHQTIHCVQIPNALVISKSG